MNNWVWVDRDGMYWAVRHNFVCACYGSAENAKAACRTGVAVWCFFEKCFDMRPLSFAEYAAFGGVLND